MLDLDILPARIRQLSSIPADFVRLLKLLDVLGMLALELLGMCYLADGGCLDVARCVLILGKGGDFVNFEN